MPEYLAPGVYIEETSFRSKSIEGVSTSTTAFVGPTRRGPITGTPELLTSYPDFERIYGGVDNLSLGAGVDGRNYVALAAQAYFQNGGSRLYVARVFNGAGGLATRTLAGAGGDATDDVVLMARFPGASGDGTVTFRELRREISGDAITRLPPGSVISITTAGGGGGGGGTTSFAVRTATGFVDEANAAATIAVGATVHLLTLNMTAVDGNGNVQNAEDMSYASTHPRYVGSVLNMNPGRRAEALENMYAVTIGSAVTFEDLRAALLTPAGAGAPAAEATHRLTGGSDGSAPAGAQYTAALTELEKLTDISIVAAPGSTEYTDASGIRVAVIAHADKRHLYRVAILDSKKGDNTGAIRQTRGAIGADRAALYYPWVITSNPLAKPGDASEPLEIAVPPSGFIAGIYARNDNERGVWKAPANEVVRGAIRFEQELSRGENEALNPLGINCLRYFPGRGYRVWGARTTSTDPEWKYLSTRRYFNYLEASIERGTQWAVFEPNGEALWANMRDTIDGFLYNEWRNGALLGTSPKEAYFVRCDRSTMTQNDLDNGRLVCLIGVAVVQPAEFVIFRIGQKTASARE